jgi:hypothetical protein
MVQTIKFEDVVLAEIMEGSSRTLLGCLHQAYLSLMLQVQGVVEKSKEDSQVKSTPSKILRSGKRIPPSTAKKPQAQNARKPQDQTLLEVHSYYISRR